MNIFRLTINVLLTISAAFGLEDTWYQGCYRSNSSDPHPSQQRDNGTSTTWPETVVSCAKGCSKERFIFMLVSVNESCGCYNNSLDHFERVDDLHCRLNDTEVNGDEGLPIGSSDNYLALYTTSGPYIHHVTIAADDPWIVVAMETVVEVEVKLSNLINITDTMGARLLQMFILKDLSHSIYEETLSTSMLPMTCHNNSANGTGDQLYTVVLVSDVVQWRVPVVFHQTGNQTFGVLVSNGLSSVSEELIIFVNNPEPQNLQVAMETDPDYQPSCIPESFELPESDTHFKVFINSEFTVKATVSHGNNLTFTFVTLNENKVIAESIDQPCHIPCGKVTDAEERCREVKKVFEIDRPGIYSITVTVENEFGNLTETLHIVAMEAKLSNLSFSMLSNSTVVPSNEFVSYQVSMEIRYRIGTAFEIEFYKDHIHNGTLEDSNSTAFSINCRQEEILIVSTYGQGCILVVQFKHKFYDEGTFKPEFRIHTNKNVSVTAELDYPVTVVNRLEGASLQSDTVVPVNQTVEIMLYLAIKSLNMSVAWVILNDLRENIASVLTTDPTLQFTFKTAGCYQVICNPRNIMGSLHVTKRIHVLDPVSGIDLACDERRVFKVGQAMTCTATIADGTDPEFYWTILDESGNEENHVSISNGNLTSNITILFEKPGKYNITFIAKNNISRVVQSHDYLVLVQIPISSVTMCHRRTNRVGDKSELKVVTSKKSNQDVTLEFDFGEGRVPFNYSYDPPENAYYVDYIYYEEGVHNVTVYAFNDVSMVTSSIDVMVEEPIDSFEIQMDREPFLGVPALFHLTAEESLLNRHHLIYTWEFSDGTQLNTTCPIISKTFSSTGTQDITCTARNLVSEYNTSLRVEVVEKPSSRLVLIHDTVVPVRQMVQFTIEGDDSLCQALDIRYGDQFAQVVEEPVNKRWTHSYENAGIYKIHWNCTGIYEEPMESWIVVEEPVGGLILQGPTYIEIKGSGCPPQWEAILDEGTDVFYKWSLDGEDIYTTYNKFTRRFDVPVEFNLTVTSYNDVSEESVSRLVIVQYPIHLQLSAPDVVLGNLAQISLNVTGRSSFSVFVDLGDGSTQRLSSADFTMETTPSSLPGMSKYHHVIQHKYTAIGEFQIFVNVSHMQSYKVQMTSITTHEPIGNITMTTKSPQYFAAGQNVTVTVAVGSGKNLQFEWDFADDYFYAKTIVRTEQRSSTATHKYEIACENGYQVKVKIGNPWYPKPVVAMLPFKFMPVDAIEDLHVEPTQHTVVLEGLNTAQVKIVARCKGTHIKFIFDFGDGHTTTIDGRPDYFFQIYGDAKHRYTQEGVYQVSVTAVNPLGNVTANLSHPITVQRLPQVPKLEKFYHIPYGQNFTFKVEHFYESEVTFDWKFGDETEVIGSRSTEVTHFYQNAGVYQLVVVANDNGEKTNATAEVYVEHQIQGVTIDIKKIGDNLRLTAYVFPSFPNLSEKYIWKFTDRNENLMAKKETTEPYIDISERYWSTAVTVEVKNKISAASSKRLLIPVSIKTLGIEKLIKGLTNQTSRFKATFYDGTEIVFEWNFGDGSPSVKQNRNESYIDHVYTMEGEYLVTVAASNLISKANVSLLWFVTNQQCDPPDITIHDSTLTKINRSEQLEYEVEFRPNVCHLTSIAADYQWRVYNKSSDVPLDIKGMEKNAFNHKEFALPPCLLAVGHYKVEVKVQIRNTIVYTKKSVNIEVLRPLVKASIKGGMARESSRKDRVILDGSLSSGGGCIGEQELKYQWNCSWGFTPSEYSCFKDGVVDALNFTSPVLSFPADYIVGTLRDPVFTLTVTNGNMTSSAVQVLQMNDDPTLMTLSIHCPQCEKQRLNSNDRLLLHAVCSNCTDDTPEFQWSVYFVPLRYYPRQFTVICHVKKLDGSSFNLMRLDNNSYDDMVLQEGNSSINGVDEKDEETGIQSILIRNSNIWRKKRESPTYRMPTIPTKLGEGSHTRSRGRSRPRYYNKILSGSFPTVDPTLLRIEDGTQVDRHGTTLNSDMDPIEEGKSVDRHSTLDQQVNSGTNSGNTDRVRPEWSQKLERKLHILEKKTKKTYLYDFHTTTGTNKGSLVIKPGFFRQDFEYIIQVKAKMKGSETILSAMTSFSINSSPRLGECEIYPESGTELISEFRIYCKAWQDMDKPLRYRVSATLDDGNEYILYHGLNHDVNFTLPAGNPSNDHKVMVDIAVLDSRMANTTVCVHSTSVRPVALEPGRRLQDFIYDQSNPMSLDGKLALAKRHGNTQKVKGVILTLSRCLQRLVAMETKRSVKVVSAVQNMLEELNQHSLSDETDVLQTVQALEGLVAVSSQFGMDAFEKTIQILRKIEAKVLVFKSPTTDTNLFMLLHKITSNLIQTLAPQEALVDMLLQQTVSKQLDSTTESLNFNSTNATYDQHKIKKNGPVNGTSRDPNFVDMATDSSDVDSNGSHGDNLGTNATAWSQQTVDKQIDSTTESVNFNSTYETDGDKQLEMRKKYSGTSTDQKSVGMAADSSDVDSSGSHGDNLGTVNDRPDYIVGGRSLANQIRRMFHEYLETVIQVHHSLLKDFKKSMPTLPVQLVLVFSCVYKQEMVYHTLSEGELTKTSDHIVSKALKFSLHDHPVLEINQSTIRLPGKMASVLQKDKPDWSNQDIFLPNQDCFQVHMTKFNFNPYAYSQSDSEMIEPGVCSVNVLTCNGSTVSVRDLPEDNMVDIEIPREADKEDLALQHRLDKAMMNIHNFNVTRQNRNNSLNLQIEMVPVTSGHLFTVAVLINMEDLPVVSVLIFSTLTFFLAISLIVMASVNCRNELENLAERFIIYNSPPTPSQYIWRDEIKGDHLKIFFQSGYLNFTGEYFIGLVDTGLNKGRPRAGEITQRNYTLKLWWNKCLFWNETTRSWSDHGCWTTEKSTYYKTHCRCNHMTTFGSHFELVPNDLSQVSVEEFFDLNENPVTIVLIGVISLLYVSLMFLCHRLDKHDARKAGITYLIDNNLGDKQKYEVTIETGLRRGAGTTAKISVILHGEEGMSETRELITDDDRPLFERNSRDKFILTLPDSIGKIMKVQMWHNNHGNSPSWYLSRVIVKDLNTSATYYFISEKWLAVEEEDGKVEREFMALDGDLDFRKVFWAKGTQYFSDFHLWLSLLTCPSYSQFNRKQRLTCCLTLLMMYMCLNAMYYKQTTPEYRGEFGLLDVSLRNITIGAICCAIVIPVSFLLVLLFRRSKTKQSTSFTEPILDEEKENDQFPSGKPNEHVQEEEEVESVQPIMTYSILDQSILNWPSIQDWAQKQWVKRHQGYQETPSSPEIPPLPNQMLQRRILGSEIDQASSGFEDSNSTDPRRQVNVSSLNSSLKLKAPSISSTSSYKRSACSSPRMLRRRIHLPFWCQYVAWFLCAAICCTCAVITIMYGYRFGVTKSIMWLQSLYFSFVVCVFITQPFIIVIAVILTAIKYRNNPTILDHYEEGEFGEQAKMEILRRKKEQVQYSEQEEFERGVAARQRSRYLRFARPPQEKQLIEARKKIMKEKKAMSLIREVAVAILMILILCIVAYGKDTQSSFYINQALKNSLIRSGPVKFSEIKLSSQWYDWSQKTMLDVLFPSNGNQSAPYQLLDNSYIIGQIQLRQIKVTKEHCYNPYNLPFVPDVCFHDYKSSNQMQEKGENSSEFKEAKSRFHIFGRHGIYDDSGYLVTLNKSRSEAQLQLQDLQESDWIDNQTRVVFVEFTLYNVPTNLFTSVTLLLEIPASGGAYPDYKIRSTRLYRYVTKWDNFVLACELMFIILTVYKIGVQLCDALRTPKYLHNFWVVLGVLSSILSLAFIGFYIYRFVLVSEMVDDLRSTYFTQYVDISFLAFWDEVIGCLLGMILFLVIIKSLKLLHYSKLFAMFGTVYKRLRRELVTFMILFFGSVFIFSRIGAVLFGGFIYSFSEIIGSILTVSALLTGIYEDYPMPDSSIIHTIRIFVLFFSVLVSGFLTSYMIAVLSYRMRAQKHKHSVAMVMDPRETILFYWNTFLLWTGIQSTEVDEEPDTVLPAEFTMAEVEYQVDELFFRINTLTGCHGLPEKPMSYFTDSDGTYGLGDDGISSGGSEINLYDDEALIHNRDNLIEETVCFNEPYLAQLLTRDSSIRGRERQIRTHLEMEIIRQLQNQKNIHSGKGSEDVSKVCLATSGDSSKSSATTSGNSSEMTTPFGDRKTQQKGSLASSLLQHQSIIHADIAQPDASKQDQFGSYQIKPDSSSYSSNPDSPDEQVKNIERVRLLKEKCPKKSKQEDITEIQKSKNTKKPEPPHKPTFLNQGLKEVQSQETGKSSVLNSPALRQLRSSLQAIERDRHSFKGESGSSVATESSSGSEQDAIHGKGGSQIKRNLRKTKSRGKGKGSVNLTSVLLDDLDTSNDENGAIGTSYKISETEPILEQENIDEY